MAKRPLATGQALAEGAALMPTRVCAEPGCPLAATYRGRCRGHTTVRNRETRSANAPLYNTARWRNTRKRYLFDHPLCECGCGRLAEDVHHKQAIQDGGEPWAMSNLEALTHACHSKITRREMTGATT